MTTTTRRAEGVTTPEAAIVGERCGALPPGQALTAHVQDASPDV